MLVLLIKTMKHLKESLVVEFLHMYRSTNVVADYLTQFIESLPSPVAWENAFPTWQTNLVAFDVLFHEK